MKSIRRIAHNPVFIFLLLTNFLFVSCSKDEFSSSKTDQSSGEFTSNKISSKKELTGEQLFRQVFFMQGGNNNLLANIPTYAVNIEKIEKLDAKQKKSSENFINEIVSLINKKNPNYFNEFKNTIQSDNPYAIDSELKNGSKLIIASIKESSKSKIVEKATEIYQKKFGSTKIKNQTDFDQIKQELTKEIINNTNVTSKEELVCVALAVAAVVAAVAWETVAVANMVAVASVFVYTKGKFWSVTDEFARQEAKLINEEVVVNLIQIY